MGERRDWPSGSFLSRLPDVDRRVLLSLGVLKRADSGTVVIRAGDAGLFLLLIEHGFAKISALSENGREALMAIRAPGELVGEVAVLNDRPRSASVIMCGESRFRLISRHDLRAYLLRYPAAALQLAATAADRLRWSDDRRLDASAYPATTRLARILAELAVLYGSRTRQGVEIGFDITQPELATLVGVSDKTVYRAITALRGDRLIETGYRRIRVTDLDGLCAVARVRV